MKITICEDESLFAQNLARELTSFFAKQSIETTITFCESCSSLQQTLTQEIPDLLFMDIQLPDCDGVETIRQLRECNEELAVIFLTSMEDRALDGYEVKAFDFLFKRIYHEKLPAILTRFLNERYYVNRIIIRESGSVTCLAVREIYWVEAENRNTKIHTQEDCFFDVEAIRHFADRLPETHFVEAYHCLYVNVDHIVWVDADSILLDNGSVVPVSRRNRKLVMSALMKRLHMG